MARFLDALDGLDGMDVVTGVVTEGAGGADTISVMLVDEQPFDWADARVNLAASESLG